MVAYSPINTAGWLSRKYENMEAAQRSTAALQGSQTGLIRAQTEEEAANAAAQRAAQYGQAAAGQGQAALSGAQAGAVPLTARSEAGLREAQAGLFGAEAGVQRSQTGLVGGGFLSRFNDMSAPVTPGAGFGASPGAPMNTRDPNDPNYSRGTSRVPGNGSPTADNVSAHLSSGEAVLNKGAAEHLGRTTIDLLNAIGQQKMGLDGSEPQTTKATPGGPGVAQDHGPNRTPGYAKGTSKVAAKGPAKPAGKPAGKSPAPKGGKTPPAQVSPQLLAALMQMGGGPQAGGMPMPGGQQPMPMPMPMTAGPPQ